MGGAPKGAPPGKGGKKVPGGPKGKAPGGSAASSNSNIPQAPSVKQYLCFIKGEPFKGAAVSGGVSPAPGGDDLDLDAAADIANMSAILDGLDGGSAAEPFTVDDPVPAAAAPSEAPPADMGNGGGLAAMLAA